MGKNEIFTRKNRDFTAKIAISAGKNEETNW